MKELLNNNFTLTIMKNRDDKYVGQYLKKIKGGVYLKELVGDEKQKINHFNNISEQIDDGRVLQIYKEANTFISMIGNICFEGPYAEERFFDVISFGIHDTLFGSLSILDNKLTREKELVHKKIYYMYGNDKYKLNEYNPDKEISEIL